MYEDEEWKQVWFLKNYYEVSNYGRVKTKGKIRPLTKHPQGHLQSSFIDINGKATQQKIHRLVALLFVPNQRPGEYNIVNHIDGNRANNYYKNLEWCNLTQNANHAVIVLRGKTKKGITDYHRTPICQFSLDGKFLKMWENSSKCAQDLSTILNTEKNSLRNDIVACATGRAKTAHGYIFSYERHIILEEHKHKEDPRIRHVIGTHKKDGSTLQFKSIQSAEGFITKDGKILSATLICACIKGRGRSSHAGYTWRYE